MAPTCLFFTCATGGCGHADVAQAHLAPATIMLPATCRLPAPLEALLKCHCINVRSGGTDGVSPLWMVALARSPLKPDVCS